jgi:hypothetical protein
MALVQQQVHGPFPLRTEQPRVGAPRAGTDAPVDGAHVVSGRVGAHLFELQSAPALAAGRAAARRSGGAARGGEVQGCGAHAQQHELLKIAVHAARRQ